VDTSKDRVKCNFCGKCHEIPHEGFPPNETLIALVNLKSNQASQCQTISEIKKNLEILVEKSVKMEACYDIGETTIRNSCDKARNSAQLAIEEAHLELDKYHKHFMERIDSYEAQCQNHLKALQKQKEKPKDVEKVLKEIKSFHDEVTCQLKNYSYDTQLEMILDKSKELLSNVQKASDRLDASVFNNKRLTFCRKYTKLSLESLGKLDISEIQPRFGINDAPLKQVDLREVLIDSKLDAIKYSTMCLLENGNIFVAYINESYKVNMAILGSNGTVLKKEKNCFEVFEEYEFTSHETFSMGNFIYILSSDGDDTYILRKVDFNLKIKCEREYNGEQKLCGFKNEIYRYDTYQDAIKIHEILNLEQKKEIINVFEEVEEESFVCHFFVTNDFFIILRRNCSETLIKVTIIGKNSSVIINSFEIYRDWAIFFLYLDKYIVSFDQNSKRMDFYDFEGNIVDEGSLERLPGNIQFMGTQNKAICAFVPSEQKFCYV